MAEDVLYPGTTDADEASATKLCYIGSVVGNDCKIAEDGFVDIYDFPPEMYERMNLDGLPHRGFHSEDPEKGIVGRISKTVDDGKTKHAFGHVDLNTLEGKLIASQIVSGGMRELSLNHTNVIQPLGNGGFLETKILKEVSSTNKGLRGPDYRVNFAVYDSTLARLAER